MDAAALDHVVLAVKDIDAAAADHAALLGRMPSWRGAHPGLGTRNVLFRLDNGYLELLAADGTGGPLGDAVSAALGERVERPLAVALAVPDVGTAVATARARGLSVSDPSPGEGRDDGSGRVRSWRSAFVDASSVRGVRLFLIQHESPAGALPVAPVTGETAAAVTAFDHVVVFTEDLEASVHAWSERVGLRVAWRRDFPDRHTRNVGLALGDVVVELILRTDRVPSGRDDVLWGVAYRTSDAARAAARAVAAGIDAGPVRDGLAAGTRVATVRWPRIATLLIEGTPARLAAHG
jgi:catechol 2,3-dioxygenase-like lactoylglutathione lyase family enzyme